MKGSVMKRGSRWVAVYDEEGDDDGKRRQRWKGGFATKKDAQAFLAGVVHEINTGGYVQPSKTPLGEYLTQEWLPSIEPDVRPLSYVAYEKCVRLHIGSRPWLARLPLQAISSAHVMRLLKELAEDGKAASSRRFVRAVLSRALADAVTYKKLARNPVTGVKLPRGSGGATGRARASVWTAREVRAFLAHVQGDRLAALYRLAATTGMRRGELLGLTWRALDLEGGRLTVEQALVPTPGGLSFAEPKTDRGKRRIALDDDTVASLRDHRETQLLERSLMADGYADHDLVFCNEDGTPYNPQRLTESFRTHVTAAGLPRIRLHDVRHTHATLALVGGVPVHVVSARLGHSSPATTLNVYSHLLPTSDESAAERVAELIAG